MKHPLSRVQQLLFMTDVWKAHDEKHFVAMVDDLPVIVHEADLMESSPLLPAALRGTLRREACEEYPKLQVSGLDLCSTADILEYGAIDLTDVHGKRHTLSSVGGLTTMASTDTMTLMCTSVTVYYTEHEGQPVPFTMYSDLRDVVVSCEELDKQYAGWHERWEIGMSLGLDKDEVLRMVFTKNTEPAEEKVLACVTFE